MTTYVVRDPYGGATETTWETVMKGVIFNLLETVVSDAHGPDAWDELLERAALEGAYAGVGRYPDEELLALVAETATLRGEDPDVVVRWFGRRAMPHLAAAYPSFFDERPDLRSFLLSLNTIVHAEVRKLYPGAVVPEFRFEDETEGAMVLGYDSPRRLCVLAEGFILGAGDHYGASVTVTQPDCMRRGAPSCRLVVEVDR